MHVMQLFYFNVFIYLGKLLSTCSANTYAKLALVCMYAEIQEIVIYTTTHQDEFYSGRLELWHVHQHSNKPIH